MDLLWKNVIFGDHLCTAYIYTGFDMKDIWFGGERFMDTYFDQHFALQENDDTYLKENKKKKKKGFDEGVSL